jgi:hypothetical protein
MDLATSEKVADVEEECLILRKALEGIFFNSKRHMRSLAEAESVLKSVATSAEAALLRVSDRRSK